MKPHGVSGIELETAGEAKTAAEAFELARDRLGTGHPYWEVMNTTATVLRARVAVHIDANPNNPDAPFSYAFFEQLGAGLLSMVLRVAAGTHEDPLVRDSATDMVASHAMHVLEEGLGGDPPIPPAPPTPPLPEA